MAMPPEKPTKMEPLSLDPGVELPSQQEPRGDVWLVDDDLVVDGSGETKVEMGTSHDHEEPGTWGRGVVREFRRTIGTWWVFEMTNFSTKTVAVSFFLYLACVAPAITFGAIYAKLVGDWMGATETLLATAWTGIFYALLGGMPVMINGGTGPVLAFTAVLYEVSISLNVPFLTFRAWIGVWTCAYMLIAAFLDLNRFMHLATRFTDEIFSTLIALIFIVNALGSPTSSVGIFHYFDEYHPAHDQYREGSDWKQDYSYIASGLLSVVGCFGTTWLAFKLKAFKTSPFLCSQRWRTAVGDFAVVAAVLVFTLIDRVAFQAVRSETLVAPDVIAPTFQCCTKDCTKSWPDDCPDVSSAYGSRPWVVDFGDLNGNNWVPIFAAVPALLAFILLFLDNGITWHLINRPENRLTHDQAYNYDTIIIGLAVLVNSVFGLPWLCAATVRSVNHLQALTERDEKTGKITFVLETRLTHFFIHVLVLITLFALKYLKLIPMSVLYGVFLYMGLAVLNGNQFFERMLMLFMQPSRYPKRPYVGRASRRDIFLLTAIQFGLFALLYIIKSIKAIALAFPIIIALCIPVRIYLLPKFFDNDTLLLLDGDESEIEAALKKKTDGVTLDAVKTAEELPADNAISEDATPGHRLRVTCSHFGDNASCIQG